MLMRSIQYIAAVAAIAAAASATAQVAFTSTLIAIGGSGVNGGFGGSYISQIPFGATGSSVGGAGSVSATGTAVVINAAGPAIVVPSVITSATLTGPGGFSAVITPTKVASIVGADGTVNQGTSSFPVYVSVKTDTYTLLLASGTQLPIGNHTYSVNLFNGATLVSRGTFNANVTVTPVPEPETYAAAAALGLVGFGLWRRRNA